MSHSKTEMLSSQIGHVMLPPELISESLKRVEGKRLEGFLGGFGKWPGSIMMVGEAPGANEIETGRPFCGQAGKVLDTYLDALDMTRDDLYITSAVRSRPYKDKPVKNGAGRLSRSNRTPTRAEVLAFAPILDREIESVKPEIIVTLGNIALHRLLGPMYNVSAQHGKPRKSVIQKVDSSHPERGYYWSQEQYWIFPMYHPAAILYNRSLLSQIEADLKALRELMDQLHIGQSNRQ